MRLVILGPQGSGKSTQAELLVRKFKIPHLQTGALFRKIAREKTKLGQRVKNRLDKGELVSDKDIMSVVEKELAREEYKKGVVLDGIPRNLKQAKALKIKIDRVFYLKTSDKEGFKRLMLRKRADDTSELIKERLRIYHRETEPILAFYRKQGVLEEVDGERPIGIIFEDILGRLKSENYSQKCKRN